MHIYNKVTKEYAEYAKSEAPKLTPSKTNDKELMGWVAATNCVWQKWTRILVKIGKNKKEDSCLSSFIEMRYYMYREAHSYKVQNMNISRKDSSSKVQTNSNKKGEPHSQNKTHLQQEVDHKSRFRYHFIQYIAIPSIQLSLFKFQQFADKRWKSSNFCLQQL